MVEVFKVCPDPHSKEKITLATGNWTFTPYPGQCFQHSETNEIFMLEKVWKIDACTWGATVKRGQMGTERTEFPAEGDCFEA